jgi:hypothetical protein
MRTTRIFIIGSFILAACQTPVNTNENEAVARKLFRGFQSSCME